MDIDVKKDNQRSTCIGCGRKRERKLMVKHGQHWTCKNCLTGEVAPESSQDPGRLKVLNLYAGIGGNRKLWPVNIQVTAVELDVKCAAAYKELYPFDNVICADAHNYLLKNYFRFDFIWVSTPCQTHTRMNFWTAQEKKRYIDLSLYQEIIFLRVFCKTKFVVENVNPYYTPLVAPDQQIGRHLFWANFKINKIHVPQIEGFMNLENVDDKKKIMDWLDIHYHKNIYFSGKNYIQVFRNAVHPLIGKSIFDDAFNL